MVNLDEEKSLSTGELKDLRNTDECVINKSCKKNFKNNYIQSIPKNNVPVYKLFEQKNYNELKERFKDMHVFFEGQTFYSPFEFKEYLVRDNRFNMRELLELSDKEDTSPFPDILNQFDSENQADTFRSNTKGIEYYTSLNDKIKFKGHIIRVISELINEQEHETSKILADLFNVEILEPPNITEIKDGVKFMLNTLRSPKLKELMPNFYKLFGRYLEETIFLIETIGNQNHYFSTKENCYNIYAYISTEGFSKIYEKEYSGYRLNKRTMGKHITASVLVGLMFKIKTDNIPFEILRIVENHRIVNNFVNRTDVLTLPVFSEKYLVEIEKNAEIMVHKNFARRNLSKDMIILDYGICKACEIYPQLKENEKILSKQSMDVLNQSVKIIDKQLDKRGFILENTLLDRLYRNNKKRKYFIKKETIKFELDRVSNSMCEDNNYVKVNLTKSLRSEFNITEKDVPNNKRPLIYIRKK